MKKGIIIAIVIAVIAFGSFMIVGNKKMSSGSVTYDGEVIKWDNPAFTDHVDLSINGADAISIDVEQYAYKATERETAISLTVHKKLDFLLKSHTVEKTFIRLDTVSDHAYADGKLSWTPIADAVKYEVEINKNGATSTEVVTTAEYPYTEAGMVSFRIKPIGATSEYYSFWSESKQVTILTAPVDVVYDDATERITWRMVQGASAYMVRINNVEIDSPVMSNYYAYTPDNILEGTSFDIEVKAVGNEQAGIYDSAYSAKKTYGYLPMVDSTQIEIKEGVLTWPAIENAQGYRIRIDNGTPIVVNTNRYEGLTTGNVNNLQIMPFNESGTYFSNWCQPLNRYIPQAPVINIQTFDNVETLISWSDQSLASGYLGELTKDGEVIKSRTELTFGTGTLGKTEFRFDFSEIGVYTFRLLAITGENVESKWSEAITVKRLGKSSAYEILDDIKEKGSSTQVRFAPVVGAKSYNVSFTSEGSNDVPIYTNLSETSFVLGELRDSNSNFINGKTITVHIMANSYRVSNKEICLGSAEPLDITVQKLAIPANFRINESKAKWDSVTGSNGYIISLGNDKGEEIVRQYVGAGVTETNLNIAEAGTYNITVRAMGNGKDVISSDETPDACTVTKLSAPTNVAIVGGKLTWSAVGNAEGYYVKVGENIVATDVSSTEYYLGEVASEVAQSVTVYALGNGGDAHHSTLDSMSSVSLSFQRLAVPVSVSVDNDEIKWSAVPNAVGYEIYDGSTVIATVSNQVSVSHTSLITQDGDHRIKVVAVGNKTTSQTSSTAYFDSMATAEVMVTKLATPEVFAVDGSNAISWQQDAQASAVQVRFNSTSNTYTSNITEFTIPKISATGNYTVYVRYMGDELASLEKAGTIASNEVEFKFEVKQFAKPVTEITVSDDKTDVTVKVTNYDTNACKYFTKWKFNNGSDREVAIADGEISYTYENVPNGSASYKVQAMGGIFYNEGAKAVYYIESEYSEIKTVVKLSKVQNIRLSGTSETVKTLKFDCLETSAVKEFKVVVDYSNGEHREYTSSSANVSIDWFTDVTVTVSITAIGPVDLSGTKIVIDSDPAIYNN